MEKTDSQLLYHFWRYEKQYQRGVLENTVAVAVKMSLNEHSRVAITRITFFHYYDVVMFCVIVIIRCL